MERLGAKYEPVVQLRDVEIVPISSGEEKYCTYNREEGNSCVGHLSGDFGQQGDRFHSSWYNHKSRSESDWNDVTPEFQADLHSAVYAIRQNVLKDHGSMLAFCQSHPEAKLSDSGGHEHYGFKLDAGSRQYFIRCNAEQYSRDSRFIVYAYDKTAALEQAKPVAESLQSATAAESTMFYNNGKEDGLRVGYLRGDFGKSGKEFHHSWFDGDAGRNTPEFKAEFQGVMDSLRQGVLKDLKTTQDFCYKHPEAQLPGDANRYCFKLETESRQYFVRCTVLPNDYFYVFANDKPTPMLEQDQAVGENANVALTISEFVNMHRRMHPNSHYFSENTLDWFGEKLEDMHILDKKIMLKTESGEIRECFALQRLQRSHPDGPQRTVTYFDKATMSEINPESNFVIIPGDSESSVKPSVMKQIRDAQNAPKPPRKAKAPEKKKDGAEL